MGVYSKVMHMLLQAAPHSEEIILSVRKNNVNNCFIYLFILVAQSCAAFSVFSFFSKNIQHLGMSHINYFEEEYTLWTTRVLNYSYISRPIEAGQHLDVKTPCTMFPLNFLLFYTLK